MAREGRNKEINCGTTHNYTPVVVYDDDEGLLPKKKTAPKRLTRRNDARNMAKTDTLFGAYSVRAGARFLQGHIRPAHLPYTPVPLANREVA